MPILKWSATKSNKNVRLRWRAKWQSTKIEILFRTFWFNLHEPSFAITHCRANWDKNILNKMFLVWLKYTVSVSQISAGECREESRQTSTHTHTHAYLQINIYVLCNANGQVGVIVWCHHCMPQVKRDRSLKEEERQQEADQETTANSNGHEELSVETAVKQKDQCSKVIRRRTSVGQTLAGSALITSKISEARLCSYWTMFMSSFGRLQLVPHSSQ